ncbi:protein containing PilT protein [mine drainage metagenome]|uniref:Protein containing PilT protein n=1 Tax=mine drainage metagenome TaxID=410659 RepID=T0Y2B9_9ZZZZ
MARQIVYWDSNAFLGLLNGEKDKEQACEDVWVAAERGLILIVTSTLTVAEVIYAKGASKLDPSKRPKVNNFFRAGHIAQKPLTRSIAELARDVVWDSGVMPKDAVYIATSAYFKIKEFHTFDGPLLNAKMINVNGFTISTQKPYAPRQLEI